MLFRSEAGKDHMFEAIDLVLQCGSNARIGMTEQIRPPRTDRIEITFAIVIDQPRAIAACDRRKRDMELPGRHSIGRAVIAHLRTRMPEHGKIARAPIAIGGIRIGSVEFAFKH